MAVTYENGIYSVDVKGREPLKMRGPAGLDDDVIRQKAISAGYDVELGAMDYAKGIGETALTAGTAMLAEPAGAIAALTGLPQSVDEAKKRYEGTTDYLTYDPSSLAGKQFVQAGKEMLAPAAEYLQSESMAFGKGVESITGSETAGAIAYALPEAALALLGLKSGQNLRKGLQLKDAQGNPTVELRALLDRQGITYENLTPNAQQLIPAKLPSGTLSVRGKPSKRAQGKVEERVVIEDIKSGGRQEGLAPLMLEDKRLGGQKVKKDPLASEAARQKWDASTIQMTKSVTPDTRAAMLEMLRRKEIIKSDRRKAYISKEEGGVGRPSAVAGDAVVKRLDAVNDQKNIALQRLDQIASDLRGVPMDPAPVIKTFGEQLKQLKVKADGVNPDGSIKWNWDASDIVLDKSAQNAVDNVFKLLKTGSPDASRFHQMKKILDNGINYAKLSKEGTGLTPKSEQFLLGMRRTLNKELRDRFPEYGKVNDTISESLGALEKLQKGVGTRVDIYGVNNADMIGQQLRRAFGNTQARYDLLDGVGELESLSKKYGADFNDNALDLTQFSLDLDKRFGSSDPANLQGTMEAAFESQLAQGRMPNLQELAIQGVAKAAEKMKGEIGDPQAFRAIERLLLREY